MSGVKDATTDTEQIRRWWATADFNVAVATGPESGIFVVDVDPRNGGEPLKDYDPHTRTGGGGYHYFFKWPEGIAKLRGKLRPGVDLKGAGGYVLAPPSRTDAEYVTVSTSEPYTAPPALVAEIAARLDAPRPGDTFNEEATWGEILSPHGWTLAYQRGEETFWTRPGKDDGVSATVNYADSEKFYVFSTSTPFEAGRGYDKFGAYAVLEHGGDITAAAAALAGERPTLRPTEPGVATPPPAPPVPSSFVPALPPEHFVSRYIAYAGRLTDAAPEYHEAAAFVLLSTLSHLVRIELAPYPDGLPTNIYVVLVGPSSQSRKSTAQSIAKSLLNALLPLSVLPDRMTGEAAIGALAMRSGQTAIWLPDEFGVMLQQIYEREFMRPLEEIMLTLYSGQEYKYLTVQGLRHIYGLHLCVFGAATPESFSGAGHRLTTGGLLPRFSVVFPDVPKPRPLSADTARSQREAILGALKAFLVQVTAPSGPRIVTVSPEALAAFVEADSVFSGNPATARLAATVYKLGALIALVDGRWVIGEADATAAIRVAKRWADGAMRLRPYVARSVSDTAFEALLGDVLAELRAAGMTGMQSRSDVARLLRLERRTLDRVRDTLQDRRQVVVSTMNGEEEWLIP